MNYSSGASDRKTKKSFIALTPISQVLEVSDVVLEDEDDLLDGRDALVGLAGPVQVVDGATKVFEEKGPVARLKKFMADIKGRSHKRFCSARVAISGIKGSLVK
jgi:hypothetical protein